MRASRVVLVPALATALLGGIFTVAAAAFATSLTFRNDDPLQREPDTQDASKVAEWEIVLLVDLATNLFSSPGDDTMGVRAGNVNTIDEVPDSNWFTNRILSRPVTFSEATRGAGTGAGPAAGPWTVVAEKTDGVAPGFTITDTAGETWFVSFDARDQPEAATSALVVANRIFWTLGYWVPDVVLARIRPEQVLIGDAAMTRPPSGRERPMRPDDLDAVWARAHRSPDGSYRAAASRRLAGRPLGGFRYHGTRPDDPNDIVPHEHRRELRALKVFGAWTNLVDLKAGNTLDMLITEQGKSVVRHYLQDTGSTFGTGALAPHDYVDGWEHTYDPGPTWKRLVSFGFYLRPWQTAAYTEYPGIGRFESRAFDPPTWKPYAPMAALRHAQPDDLFWAARRVMAFSDDMIRAIVSTGDYSVPAAADHLARTLMARRDRIGAAYLPGVSPLIDLALTADGRLTFANAAVAAGVQPAPDGYRVRWEEFDNQTGARAEIGETVAGHMAPHAAPGRLPTRPDAFVRVTITPTMPAPAKSVANEPLVAHFRRTAAEWRLVGLDRMSR